MSRFPIAAVESSIIRQSPSYHHNALGIVDELITPHPLYNSLAQIKRVRQIAYKQLFEGRFHGLHVRMIELFNDRADKGNVLGDEGYQSRIERLIGRVTIKGNH